MNNFNYGILLVVIVFLFVFIFGMGLEAANAATNQIPWRFYQLYSGQALQVNCKAEEMSVVPQSNLSVLILCGPIPDNSR